MNDVASQNPAHSRLRTDINLIAILNKIPGYLKKTITINLHPEFTLDKNFTKSTHRIQYMLI